MMSNEPFIYGEESASHGVFKRVTVPASIASEKELFDTLASLLDFPDYFGENWDAFAECVRDLSWLSPGRVVLVHVDIPLVNDVANARTYLAILSRAVHKMSTSEDHPLSVVFPAEFREPIDWLLRSQKNHEARRFT
jgi:RNAse (barnase) inhibitor barstar